MKKWFLLILLKAFILNNAQAQNLALTGLTIIDANHRQPLEHQTVLIKDGIICRIFDDGSKPLPDSFNIISLKGKYLLPGLIDTHVHMATDPSGTDNRDTTIKVLNRMLYSGITSVRDMAGDARVLAGLSRDALTGDILSPDIYFSALMAGPDFFSDPRTHASTRGAIAGRMPYMRAVSDSTNLELAVAEAKGTGASGIKLYADLPASLAAGIIAEAKKQGILVWGHAWLKPAKPSELVKAGISSISHAPLLIYDRLDSIPSSWKTNSHDDRFWNNAVPDLSSLFTLMKEKHVLLDATLSAYRQWAVQDTSRRYYYEIAKRITARAYRAGVKICAGTDDDQEEFVQHEMKLLVDDAGFSTIDAIIAATKYGAEAIGIDSMHGTIEINKAADLLVLDKDPLASIDNIRSVYMVIKAGKIFKKP